MKYRVPGIAHPKQSCVLIKMLRTSRDLLVCAASASVIEDFSLDQQGLHTGTIHCIREYSKLFGSEENARQEDTDIGYEDIVLF